MAQTVFNHSRCPVCDWNQLVYTFATSGGAFFECTGCGIFLCDQTRSTLEQKSNDFWNDAERLASGSLSDEERKSYLHLISQQTVGKRLLEIGCRDGAFLSGAKARGFEVTGFEGNQDLAKAAQSRLGREAITCAGSFEGVYPPGSFDVVVLFDLLGIFADPIATMRTIRGFLRENGIFLFCVPTVDSRPAVLLRESWVEFNKRQSILFNTNNVQNALFLTGFDRTLVLRHPRRRSIDGLRNYLSQFKLPWRLSIITKLAGLLPGFVRKLSLRVEGSHAVVATHARKDFEFRVLSIVIPVYNERKTFKELMDAVLAKELAGLKKEIIVVESNSTDGSREEVLRYKDRPEVRVILQERPLGKGNAVRAGLAEATGDFILIQDADLEYDVEDYDALIEPLRTGREAFVLGSRHGYQSVWKMRKFNNQSGLSFVMNFGHLIFTGLINVLFRQRLYDPFTMFKVFRRDCLYGLEFECNRFDFDYELLIKLIRKGYRPVELPVNYRSRSFVEGKKIRFFSDPLNWLKAIAWLRFVKVDPLEVIRRTNAAK